MRRAALKNNNQKKNNMPKKKNTKRPPAAVTAASAVINNGLVFLDLTCTREQEEHYFDQDMFPSTHDSAEMMLYAYVDSAPSVADLLWSKQQLGQDHFLKLTDEQEWSELPTVDFSTHEPFIL